MTFTIACHLRSALLAVLLALLYRPVHSWDFVLAIDDHLKFYHENNTIESSSVPFANLSTLTYDATSQIVYFSYEEDGFYVISSARNKLESTCLHYIKHTLNSNRVESMTYDPVTQQLFWTDLKNIYSLFVLSKSETSENEARVLLKMLNNEQPSGIAVDSCRGVLYWTNTRFRNATIERINIDGTDRKILFSKDVYYPLDITINQKLKRIYWVDDMEGIHFKIEYSNLDGSNRVKMHQSFRQSPANIFLHNNNIYYIDTSGKYLYRRDVKSNDTETSTMAMKFSHTPSGIVSYSDILEDLNGVEECKKVVEMIQSNLPLPVNSTTDSTYCLNGGILEDENAGILSKPKKCNCPLQYSGERCERNLCYNYCMNGGNCSVNNTRQPKCNCNDDFTGLRCQQLICKHGEIINDQCECTLGWSGSKCDVPVPIATSSSISTLDTTTDESENMTTLNINNNVAPFAESVCDTVYFSTESAQIVLSLLCCFIFILLLLVTYLVYKIKLLRRRPRIIKRIIAKKNATPLTIRPNQNDCEITIENCCNMNICETPCFEPENFRDHLIDFRMKDEKKNLLSNINQGLDY